MKSWDLMLVAKKKKDSSKKMLDRMCKIGKDWKQWCAQIKTKIAKPNLPMMYPGNFSEYGFRQGISG